MPDREPNLHPGALEPVRPGDRWLIRRRGDDEPWVGITRRPMHAGAWRVTVEATRSQTTVGRESMVRLLGPAPFPAPEFAGQAAGLLKAGLDIAAAIRELNDSILRLEDWLLKEITKKPKTF